VWVSDVFAWRPVPASYREDLVHVLGVHVETPGAEDLQKLHRLGDNPTVATLTPVEGEPIRVAVASEHGTALLGPYGAHADSS
jgi:hypothetical protein